MRNLFPLAILAIIMHSCINDRQADLILFNGTIYTIDNSFSTAEAMVIRNGRIVSTGTDKEILEKCNAGRIVDLEEGFVYPGLIDAHCHFTSYGLGLRNADLTGTASFDEVINILKEHDAKYPSEWLLGRGWDQNDWDVREFPTRDKLDLAFPGKPVLIKRIDGHAALANSEALKRADVTAESAVDGGSLIKKDGKLTGVLVDNAISLVQQHVPESSRQDMINALMQGQENCFAVGLTTVHEAGLGYETIDLIDSLQKTGALKMRIYAMLNPGPGNYEKYLFKGIYQTEALNVRSIKLFADGALGSRGALLLEPYSDDPGNHGLAVETDAFLREQCRLALENGYQVNTHCIGDSANRWMLDMYADFLKGNNDKRWRIEHSQIIHVDDFSKFRTYSIVPSIQSTHGTSDMYWAGERVGPERMDGAYAFRVILEQNGWLPNGSDFPVEHINPLFGYYALIARKDLEGYPEEGFQMENSLTREEALRSMTIWAAKAAFEEQEKGSLEPGKMADFIVTREDLMEIPVEKIPGVKVQRTYLGGEKVFDAQLP